MSQLPRAPLSPIVEGEQGLSRELGGYLVKVLRLRAGDAFVVFDPDAGSEADAKLLHDVPARARIGAPRAAPRTARREVMLVQGLAKGDKPEQVARAAVALGATEVRFVKTERSIAGAELRSERLRAVMVDAARQCGRGDLPRVQGPMELVDSAGAAPLRYVLDPRAQTTLVEALRAAPPEAALALAVGPEGGFSPAEQEQLMALRFVPVRLAPFVLRTELAAVAALAVVAAHQA